MYRARLKKVRIDKLYFHVMMDEDVLCWGISHQGGKSHLTAGLMMTEGFMSCPPRRAKTTRIMTADGRNVSRAASVWTDIGLSVPAAVPLTLCARRYGVVYFFFSFVQGEKKTRIFCSWNYFQLQEEVVCHFLFAYHLGGKCVEIRVT